MSNDQITALVTGANRGLGKRFAAQLIERGAKVYAAARRPETIDVSGVEPIQLDITDPASVRRAADVASDVTVLVNNAGTATRASVLSGAFEDVRLEMETHYFGTLNVIRTFAPIIEGNGGGAILNMLSVLSWLHASDLRRLFGSQGGRVGDDRRNQAGTCASRHPRHRRARRLHRHRHGRLRACRSKERSRGRRPTRAGRLVRRRAGDPRRRPNTRDEGASVRRYAAVTPPFSSDESRC